MARSANERIDEQQARVKGRFITFYAGLLLLNAMGRWRSLRAIAE
ncbi:hypothetical protein F220043C3_40120 [Enterocloster asparagiformis]